MGNSSSLELSKLLSRTMVKINRTSDIGEIVLKFAMHDDYFKDAFIVTISNSNGLDVRTTLGIRRQKLYL